MGHFNFLKFYILLYFISYIHRFKSINRYNIKTNSKVGYKFIVKVFFNFINKQNYLLQIYRLNLKRVAVLAIEDILKFENTISIPLLLRDLEVQITGLS